MKKYSWMAFSLLLFFILLIVNLLELDAMRLNKSKNSATPNNAEYEQYQKEIENTKQTLVDNIVLEEGKEFLNLYETDYRNIDINNFYKKSDTEYLIDYSILSKRYICRIRLSDEQLPKVLFVMDNSEITFEQEEYKELEKLLKYTNFSIEEYSLENLDFYEIEEISHYGTMLYISIEDNKVKVYLKGQQVLRIYE